MAECDTRGFSPLVAVVFVVAVVVVLSLTLGVLVMGFSGGVEREETESVADGSSGELVESAAGSDGPLVVVDAGAVVVAGGLVAAGLVVRSGRVWRAVGRVGSVIGARVAAWWSSDGSDAESDPVDEVRTEYVEGELADVALERELEQALRERSDAGEGGTDRTDGDG